MERRFTMNDFERSLKEQADDFKMIPSKRVWHGIYNDLHPGRRWPSITMSFLLIFSLLFIGYLNTHNKAQQSGPSKIASSGESNRSFSGVAGSILNNQLLTPLISNYSANKYYLADIDAEFGSVQSNSEIKAAYDKNDASLDLLIPARKSLGSDKPELSAYERNNILLP